MEFISPLFFVILGFAILLVGGELLIKAAVSIAARLNISPAIIGLTVIAAGTSAPELVTSLIASYKGAPDVAMGNIIGSNIFNILAILGIASLIRPNKVDAAFARFEIPMLILCTVLFTGFLWDLTLFQYEGFVCIAVLIVLFYISIYRAKKIGFEADEDISVLANPFLDAAYLLAGCAALIGGAHIVLENGIEVGQRLGLSERIIGITIISVGTGLPELATSAVAAFKGRNDIAVGNVIGSNLMNTMGVGGVASSIKNIQVSKEIAHFDSYILLGVTITLLVIIRLNKLNINKATGALLLSGYIGYVAMLIYR